MPFLRDLSSDSGEDRSCHECSKKAAFGRLSLVPTKYEETVMRWYTYGKQGVASLYCMEFPFKLNFSVGVIVALVVQTGSIFWWASGVQAQVNQSRADIADIKAQLVDNTAVVLTRQQLNDILGVRDAKIDALTQDISEFKADTRATLSRIERKL